MHGLRLKHYVWGWARDRTHPRIMRFTHSLFYPNHGVLRHLFESFPLLQIFTSCQGIRQLTLLNGLKPIIIPFGTRHKQEMAASSATDFPIYIHFLMKVRLTLMSSLHLSNHRGPHKPRQLSLSLTIIWTTSIYQTLPILVIWSIRKTLSSRKSKWKVQNSHSRSSDVYNSKS